MQCLVPIRHIESVATVLISWWEYKGNNILNLCSLNEKGPDNVFPENLTLESLDTVSIHCLFFFKYLFNIIVATV